jgi:hypothetical protein
MTLSESTTGMQQVLALCPMRRRRVRSWLLCAALPPYLVVLCRSPLFAFGTPCHSRGVLSPMGRNGGPPIGARHP